MVAHPDSSPLLSEITDECQYNPKDNRDKIQAITRDMAPQLKRYNKKLKAKKSTLNEVRKVLDVKRQREVVLYRLGANVISILRGISSYLQL